MSRKFKHKVTLSREEAANRIRAIGEAVAAGGEVTLELNGQRAAASMPDTLTLELEVEENELEIELKWVTTAPTPPGSAPASEPAGTTATGQAGDAAPQPPSSAGQAPAW
jgi:amphi-Trp domain-containing protein